MTATTTPRWPRLKVVQADTLRFDRRDAAWRYLGRSPNRGLECYVGEAVALHCKGIVCSKELQGAAGRVMAEARELDTFLVWGWERKPSIVGVEFPFDWDDTCKAIDFLNALPSIPVPEPQLAGIPDSDFWMHLISESLFTRGTIGEDTSFDSAAPLALSVFFGPASLGVEKRDDPMVTAVMLRTTGLHYPEVARNHQATMFELLRRVSSVLNLCLERDIPFSAVSRYYYSLGHFAYRLFEAMRIHGFSPADLGIRIDLVDKKVSSTAGHANAGSGLTPSVGGLYEANWWKLAGTVLELPVPQPLVRFPRDAMRHVDIVYRHRRLEHYYGARGWHYRVQKFAGQQNSQAHIENGK